MKDYLPPRKALEYYHKHPERWPVCQTCGKKMPPTGTTKDNRVEFHCGIAGHSVTVAGLPHDVD